MRHTTVWRLCRLTSVLTNERSKSCLHATVAVVTKDLQQQPCQPNAAIPVQIRVNKAPSSGGRFESRKLAMTVLQTTRCGAFARDKQQWRCHSSDYFIGSDI